MKKHKNVKKNLIIAAIFTALVLGAIIASLLLNNTLNDTLKQAVGIKSTAPVFAFNEQDTQGWWAADNYNSREHAGEYKDDKPVEKLSVASRNIFQSRDTTIDSCFVMYAYYDYTADIDALQKKREDDASNSTGLVYTKLPTQMLSIDTPEGAKSYDLHKYAISGPGSEQMQRGMSWGYVKLSDGYITVDGSCPEGSQLDSTAVGMKNISLVK